MKYFSIALPAILALSLITPVQADFSDTLKEARAVLDEQMALPITIPTPKDAGGGYTHEKHKENAKLIYQAGALYTLTGDARYARFAARLLESYADVYSTWGLHPAKKEQSPGRMFWQNLNESWWLLYVAQGYNAIQTTLSDRQRDNIETNLLRQVAEFLSTGSPKTFNKIHNHGTWATAAVGITGYALDDQTYVEKALFGLDRSGRAGFLKQLDRLFSPDGYYNEGPYYQRYALMPFVLFAQAIEQNEPERKIFSYRDSILKKAIYATIEQSYNGLFFPINDAIKDKGIDTTELLYGVAIAYELTQDPTLLSVAQAQGRFVLTPQGRALSDAIDAGKAQPFAYRTIRLRDGPDGNQGALDILRSSSDPKDLTLVMKNTSQGMGHGHFDKLALLVYDQGEEILRDYGAARFLNVEAKYGGHYLPENNSYAKQTVAHNTLVIGETSHFKGNGKTAEQYAPQAGLFVNESTLKLATAEIDSAYKGVRLVRKSAIIKDAALLKPVIIDVIQAHTSKQQVYDLPFHYNGQLVETNFPLKAETAVRKPFGSKNGYQHLWKVGQANPKQDLSQVTFLLNHRFYTVSTAIPAQTQVIFVETGAQDPNFNLRREPGFILRSPKRKGVSYVSVIEPHGEYNPRLEYTLNSHTQIKQIRQFQQGSELLIELETVKGDTLMLALSDQTDPTKTHQVSWQGRKIHWQGPYHLFASGTQ
ncbi:MAG: heparinase II/III domain-containing protein [Gammaproteobacteria bacterium]